MIDFFDRLGYRRSRASLGGAPKIVGGRTGYAVGEAGTNPSAALAIAAGADQEGDSPIRRRPTTWEKSRRPKAKEMSVTFELFRALSRRRRLILGLFVLLGFGVVAGAYLKPPSYQSHAKLLLNLGERPISVSGAEMPPSGAAVQTVEAVTTLSEIFASRDLLEQLVDEMGVEAFQGQPTSNPVLRRGLELVEGLKDTAHRFLVGAQLVEPQSPRTALVSELEKRLSIYPVRQSQVIEVAFSWRNPSVPPVVLRHLLDIYVERVNALNAQTAEQTVLSEEAERARAALDQAQSRLRELRRSTDIVDPAKEREALTDRIEKLAPLLGNSQQDDGAGVAVGGNNGPGAEISALRRQLNELRIERAGAVAKFTPDSPNVRALDAQIEAAEQALGEERAKIEAALDADRKRLEHVLDAEKQFSDAFRNVDLATLAYQTYTQAASDRNVMRLADEEFRLRIIDVPADQAPASGPSRLMILLAGLIAAAMVACLVALLIDRLSIGAEPMPDSHEPDREEPSQAAQAARLWREEDGPALRTSVIKR